MQTNLWLFNWPEVFFQRLVLASLASSSSMLTVSSGCSPKCLIIPSTVFLSSSLQVDYRLDNVTKWARFYETLSTQTVVGFNRSYTYAAVSISEHVFTGFRNAGIHWDLKCAPPSRQAPPPISDCIFLSLCLSDGEADPVGVTVNVKCIWCVPYNLLQWFNFLWKAVCIHTHHSGYTLL